MRHGRTAARSTAALAVIQTGASLAALTEVETGVFVEDFEKGHPGQLAANEKEAKQPNRVPAVLEVVRDGGKAALHLKGRFQNRLYCQDRQFGDFALTVRMRKTTGSCAGVVVRDHRRVYFEMKGYLSTNSEAPGLESKGELYRSAEAFRGCHELKVVCAGPLLHA